MDDGKQTITASNRSFFADFVNVFSGKVAHIALSLAIGIATARIWGADGRGLIAVVMIWPMFACRFFEQGVMRSLPYQIGQGLLPLEQAGRVITNLWIAMSAVSLGIVMAVLVLVIEQDLTWPWILTVGLCVLLNLFNSFAKGFALAAQKPQYLTQTVFLRGPLSLGVILIAGGALGYHAISNAWIYILAMDLGYLVVFIYSLRFITRFTHLGFTRDLRLTFKTFLNTIRFGAGGMLMHLNYYADVLLLGLPIFLIPKEDIGNYSVGVAAAGMLWQVPRAMGILMLSRGALADDPLKYNLQVASAARGSTIVALPVMLLVFFLGPYLFPLVYGTEFNKAGTIVQILSPSILAFFGARIYESGFNARGMAKPLITIMGAVAAANILLNLLLIPDYGIYGAAWASAITYPIGSVALGIAYARSSAIPIKDMFLPRADDIRPITRRLARLMGKKHRK